MKVRRALACVPGLWNPVRNHEQFLELIFAVGGDGLQHSYDRFRASAHGQQLLRDKPDIVGDLTDLAALGDCPPGSLGHAYLDFMSQNRLDAGLYDNTHHDLPAIAARLGWDEDFHTIGMLMSAPLGVRRSDRLRWWRESVTRGREAEFLFAIPFESLLSEPLTAVRSQLRIAPDETAHPHGHLYSRFQFGTARTRTTADAYEPYRYDPDRLPTPI